jgi:hypothetical protein
VGGRDRRDSGSHRTSAPPVADTRREGYPAWQRARHPAELCDQVAWNLCQSGSLGIRQPESGGCVRSEGAILGRQVRFAATILD